MRLGLDVIVCLWVCVCTYVCERARVRESERKLKVGCMRDEKTHRVKM